MPHKPRPANISPSLFESNLKFNPKTLEVTMPESRMEARPTEMCFVAVSTRGEAPKPGHTFAVRSHIRRAVTKEKMSRLRPAEFKFVRQEPGAKKIRRKRKPAKSPPQTQCDMTSRVADSPQMNLSDPSSDSSYENLESIDNPDQLILRPACSKVRASLRCTHPYAILAARYLDITPQRLDQLFKSRAFQEAAEPLFDTNHVDSPLSMTAVFPTCLEDSAFFHALVYSILQSQNRGVATLETFRIKERTIEALKETIVRGRTCPGQDSMAAIMLLRGTAYKWEDYSTHQLHAQGLSRALASCQRCLTPATQRAVFWQDLCASVLIGSPRQLTHTALSDQISWQWSTETVIRTMPSGFIRHQAVLPDSLLNCVLDCKELQTSVLEHSRDANTKNILLDSMQASIESRLALLTLPCKAFGAVASAVRLAVFIICYVSWMETWDSALIPARVAEQLLDILEQSFTNTVHPSSMTNNKLWQGRRDLQLWVILIGIDTAKTCGRYVDGLYERYGHILRQYCEAVGATVWPDSEQECNQHLEGLNQTLHNALYNYIYPQGYLDRRLHIVEWFELELLMNAVVLQDEHD